MRKIAGGVTWTTTILEEGPGQGDRRGPWRDDESGRG